MFGDVKFSASQEMKGKLEGKGSSAAVSFEVD